jgi:inosine-uridine nucleoside N-ribohydrolase
MQNVVILAAILSIARVAAAATVWIDTDVAIGSPFRDVDDGYALVLAFHSPEIHIAGISATYGNAPVGHTKRVAAELVRRFGASAKLGSGRVFAGAASARDLGRSTDATEALSKVLEKRSVTYVALGPLTNLASFLQLHPEQARRIERVIFIGGQVEGTTLGFGPERTFLIHDANVFKDPVATAHILNSKIPRVLVPIAASRSLLINEDDLRQLQQRGGAAEYVARRSKVWLWFWTRVVKEKGGPIFDAFAVMAAAKPELVGLKKATAKMDEAGNLMVSGGLTTPGRGVLVCTRSAPNLKRVVLERLGKQ